MQSLLNSPLQMLLLVFSSSKYVSYKSGTFGAQCKLSNSGGAYSQQNPFVVSLLERGKKYTNPSDLTNFTFTPENASQNVVLISNLLGKNMLEFNVTFDKYPKSFRFRGKDTPKIEFAAKGGFELMGVTQTIWGGANTAYMIGRPACHPDTEKSGCLDFDNGVFAYKHVENETKADSGDFKFTWDIKEEDFVFNPAGGLQALTLTYSNSGVATYFSKEENLRDNKWATSNFTSSSVKKYWPVTRKDGDKIVKGGPKHGEMAVFALTLSTPFNLALQCGSTPQQVCFQDLIMDKKMAQNIVRDKQGTPKINVVHFELNGKEYSIYNTANAQLQCVTQIFSSYDIYWNTWALVFSVVMLLIAAICIIPTKCFDLRAMLKRKNATVAAQEMPPVNLESDDIVPATHGAGGVQPE